MTGKLSKAVERVIDLAQTIREYWDAELPKRHPDYPVVHLGEDSGPPPPQEAQLHDLLAELPEDAIYKLILIMYLGRGAFGTKDLAENYHQLKATFSKPEWAASQMMGKAPLADYLRDGLEKLRESKIDIDNLFPPKAARARR